MLKWFSFSGISKEVKRIRWPKKEELGGNSMEVLIFCAFLAFSSSPVNFSFPSSSN